MAFIPTNDASGNLVIGQSGQTLTLSAGKAVLTNPELTYTTSGNYTYATRYRVVPVNTIPTYVPYLVEGYLTLNQAPWYFRYAFNWVSLQQNGSSAGSGNFVGFNHMNYALIDPGRSTTYYADGTAPLDVALYTYSTFTSVYGSWTHYFYRIGA